LYLAAWVQRLACRTILAFAEPLFCLLLHEFFIRTNQSHRIYEATHESWIARSQATLITTQIPN